MRAFLNAILAVIGSTSLTDVEFDTITATVADYTLETYTQLLAVIDSRETVSNTRDRLTYYYLARGVEVSASTAGKSNIYVGDALCE